MFDDYFTIMINGSKKEYKIDAMKAKDPLKVRGEKYLVEITTTGYYRQIEIRNESVENEVLRSKNKTHKFTEGELYKSFRTMIAMKKNITICSLDLLGFGVSIINKEPKEILYLSIFKIKADFQQNIIEKPQTEEIETSIMLDLKINHLQVDNMTGDENPIILTPVTALDKRDIDLVENIYVHRLLKNLTKNDEETPFFQASFIFFSSEVHQVARKKVDKIELNLEPIIIEIESGILMTIISTILEISNVFDEETFEQSITGGVNDTQVNMKDERHADKKVNMIEEAKVLKEYLKKTRDISISEDEDSDFDHVFDKSVICTEIDSNIPQPPDLGDINTDKLFFKSILIEKLKVLITFRMEKQAINIELKQGFGLLPTLYTFLSSVASVSKVPFKFDRYNRENMFKSQSQLISMISTNYMRQAFFQFYKIFLAIDVLGNPLGF